MLWLKQSQNESSVSTVTLNYQHNVLQEYVTENQFPFLSAGLIHYLMRRKFRGQSLNNDFWKNKTSYFLMKHIQGVSSPLITKLHDNVFPAFWS